MAKLLILIAISLAGWHLNVTNILDPKVGFGFERTHYRVQPKGLAWQQSTRTLDGKEAPADSPHLNLFPKPERKTSLRLLFLTRASDQNYNTSSTPTASPKRPPPTGAFIPAL